MLIFLFTLKCILCEYDKKLQNSTNTEQLFNQSHNTVENNDCNQQILQNDDVFVVNMNQFILANDEQQYDKYSKHFVFDFLEITHQQKYFRKDQNVIEIIHFTNNNYTKICFIIQEQELQQSKHLSYLIDCTQNIQNIFEDNKYKFEFNQRKLYQIKMNDSNQCSQFEFHNNSLYFLCKNQNQIDLKIIRDFEISQNYEIEKVLSTFINSTQQNCKTRYLIIQNQVLLFIFSCEEWSFKFYQNGEIFLEQSFDNYKILDVPEKIRLENINYCESSKQIYQYQKLEQDIILLIFDNLYIDYSDSQKSFSRIDDKELFEYHKLFQQQSSEMFDFLFFENKLNYFKKSIEALKQNGRIKLCQDPLQLSLINNQFSLLACSNSLLGFSFNQIIFEYGYQYQVIKFLPTEASPYFIAVNNSDIIIFKYSMILNHYPNRLQRKGSKFLQISDFNVYTQIIDLQECLQLIDNQNQKNIFLFKNIKTKVEILKNFNQTQLKLIKNQYDSNFLFNLSREFENQQIKVKDFEIMEENLKERLMKVLLKNDFKEYNLFYPNFNAQILITKSYIKINNPQYIIFQGYNYSIILYNYEAGTLRQHFIDVELRDDRIFMISQFFSYLLLDRFQKTFYKLSLNYDTHSLIEMIHFFDKKVKSFYSWTGNEILLLFNDSTQGIMNFNLKLENIEQFQDGQIDYSKVTKIIRYLTRTKIIQTKEKLFIMHNGRIVQAMTIQFELMSLFSHYYLEEIYTFQLAFLDQENQEILIYYVSNDGYFLRTKIKITKYVLCNPPFQKYFGEYLLLLVQDESKYLILIYNLQKLKNFALMDIIQISTPYFELYRSALYYLNENYQLIEYDLLYYQFEISDIKLKNITNQISLTFHYTEKQVDVKKNKPFKGSFFLNYNFINDFQELIVFNTLGYVQVNQKINFHDYVAGNIDNITLIIEKNYKLLNPFHNQVKLSCQKVIQNFCIVDNYIVKEIQINYQFQNNNYPDKILLLNHNSQLIMIYVKEYKIIIEIFSINENLIMPYQNLVFNIMTTFSYFRFFQNQYDTNYSQYLIQFRDVDNTLKHLYFLNGQIYTLQIETQFSDFYFNQNIEQANVLVRFENDYFLFVLFYIQVNEIYEIGKIYLHKNDLSSFSYNTNQLVTNETQIKINSLQYSNYQGILEFIYVNKENPVLFFRLIFDLKSNKKNLTIFKLLKIPGDFTDFSIVFVNQDFLILQSSHIYVYQISDNRTEGFYCYKQKLDSKITQLNTTHFYWTSYNDTEQILNFVYPQSYKIEFYNQLTNQNLLALDIQNAVSKNIMILKIINEGNYYNNNVWILLIIIILLILILIVFLKRRSNLLQRTNIVINESYS